MTPGTAACAKTEQVLPQSQRECMASDDKGMGEARLLTFQGLRGGPTWEYRGALIETTGQRFPDQNFLRMAGHPQDGACGSAWNRNPVGGVIGVQTGPH
ncbi:Hypothetical protein RADP37_02755 [Roseomonas mucosa]|uniref:Uncharacterized protein n=1 Tax=Roseomonas mucosa TaxID=207340 RepID=A0A4Y1MZP7_9PROT|nr:Hypothetical protein RADP37_02755 [Roseomonas mucosa]